MENLRVRYVITYVSSTLRASDQRGKIQVELVEPKTGQALKIHDATGKPVAAKVLFSKPMIPAPPPATSVGPGGKEKLSVVRGGTWGGRSME